MMEESEPSTSEENPQNVRSFPIGNSFNFTNRSFFRPSLLMTAFTRPPVGIRPICSAGNETFEQFPELITDRRVIQQSLQFSKEITLKSFLAQSRSTSAFDRHYLYKPHPMQSFTIIPEKRFIRLRPRNENSSITVIEIFQQYLMVGTSNGLVAMFDMNSMSVSRIYNLNENHPVNQIITSKKEARFFVVCHNCFIRVFIL